MSNLLQRIHNKVFLDFNQKIIQKKYNILDNSDYELELNKISKLFNNYKSQLNLKDNFDNKNILSNEIKKCLIRSLLRYNSFDLADKIVKKFKNNKNTSYYTSIYPMIHMVNDKLEQGTMHHDQGVKGKMSTLWTPITNYNYNALSYLPSGYYGNLFNKKIKKIFSEIEIKPVKYQTLYWGGYFPHRGNMNTSSELNCALVIRVGSMPVITEPNRKIDKIYTNSIIHTDIEKIYLKLNSIIYELTRIEDIEDRSNILKLVNKHYDDNDHKIISFAISIISQRFRVKKKQVTSDLAAKINSSIFDLFSILIGAENLVCLRNLYLNNEQSSIKLIIESCKNYTSYNTKYFNLFCNMQKSEKEWEF